MRKPLSVCVSLSVSVPLQDAGCLCPSLSLSCARLAATVTHRFLSALRSQRTRWGPVACNARLCQLLPTNRLPGWLLKVQSPPRRVNESERAMLRAGPCVVRALSVCVGGRASLRALSLVVLSRAVGSVGGRYLRLCPRPSLRLVPLLLHLQRDDRRLADFFLPPCHTPRPTAS